jgi:hypothetical protein
MVGQAFLFKRRLFHLCAGRKKVLSRKQRRFAAVPVTFCRLLFFRNPARRGPEGRPLKRQPSPEGLGWNPHHDLERHRRGTHGFLNQSAAWRSRGETAGTRVYTLDKL